VDDEAVLGVVGGGFALAATLGCLARARLARSHRRANELLAWLVGAGALLLVGLSLLAAPGAYADGWGAVLRLLRGES
jgi:hypothetical protein